MAQTIRAVRAPTHATAGRPAVDDTDDRRTVVTFSRLHPRDIGQRQVFVRLDGGAPIALLYGETCSAEVEPGRHHVRAHNTLFWKNISFTIEAGEHLEFILINHGAWWTAGIVGFLGSAPLFLKVIKRSVY